jgi:hypothetical protein
MFAYIETKCTIKTNKTCGFHVHMSPYNGEPWSVQELRSICFAIIYFEEAILALLPRSRRYNDHLLSNYVHNPKLARLSLNEC